MKWETGKQNWRSLKLTVGSLKRAIKWIKLYLGKKKKKQIENTQINNIRKVGHHHRSHGCWKGNKGCCEQLCHQFYSLGEMDQFLQGHDLPKLMQGTGDVNRPKPSVTFPSGASQMALVVKNLPTDARDTRDVGSNPGSGRSPGRGNGHPLQYSCLQSPMDRGAWWGTVHGVAKSRIRLSGWAGTQEPSQIEGTRPRRLHQWTLLNI